jgi:tetratricopeptide (TPR) repeat protein
MRFESLGPRHNGLAGKLLIRQAGFLARSSQPEKALVLINKSMNLISGLDLPAETAHIYQVYGYISRFKGRLDEALLYLEKSLTIFRRTNNSWYIANLLAQISDCAYRMGNFEKARQSFWEAYNIHRRIGDPRGMAFTLSGLGVLLNQIGEADNAITLLQESIRLFRSVNDRYGTAVSSHNLGAIAMARQDYISARPYFEESLAAFQEMTNKFTLAAALNGLGIVNYELGSRQQAKEYLARALDLTYQRELMPLLLETLVQSAVIANEENQPQLAAEILAFALAHPALDKAETEGRAKNIWYTISDRLSSDVIQRTRRAGEQKELAEAVSEAATRLTRQGENQHPEPDRLSHRISQ